MTGRYQLCYTAHPNHQPRCGGLDRAPDALVTISDALRTLPQRGGIHAINTHRARANAAAARREPTHMASQPVLAVRGYTTASARLCTRVAADGHLWIITALPTCARRPRPCGAQVWVLIWDALTIEGADDAAPL